MQAQSYIVYSCLAQKIKLNKIIALEIIMREMKIKEPILSKNYNDFFENAAVKARINNHMVNSIKKEIYYQQHNGDIEAIRIWYRQFRKLMKKMRV
jgi:hypothetical protein